MTLKDLERKFAEFTKSVEDMNNFADKEGVCPHCVNRDIIEIDKRVSKSIKKLALICKKRKKNFIKSLKKFDETLSRE